MLLKTFLGLKNTSIIPLAGAATLTGDWELNDHRDVMVSCRSDVEGTLFFDFSNDGVKVNTFPVIGFKIAANIHEFHTALKGPRYFRVRLVNGSGAQSFLDLYTYYGEFRQGNSPINQNIGSDSDAIVVRTVSTDIDLALGRIGGMEEGASFGIVNLLDAADPATDIWHWGSDGVSGTPIRTFPTSAVPLYVASSNSGDVGVEITGTYIDGDGNRAALDVFLNGQTSVQITAAAFDVLETFVSGPTAALGDIYITTADNFSAGGVPNDATEVLSYIQLGRGHSQNCTYTVPVGFMLQVKWVAVTLTRASGAAGAADIHFRVRPFGGTWRVDRDFNTSDSSPVDGPQAGMIYPERTSIVMRVEDVSDNDSDVHAQFQFNLIGT